MYLHKGCYELRGVCDILGVLKGGRFLGIEVKKNAKSRPSKYQLEFMANINDNGGLAFTAYNIDMVEKRLKEYL